MPVAMTPLHSFRALKTWMIYATLCFAGTLNAATCSVVSAVLNFGSYDGLAPAATLSPGLVRVSCTKDAALLTEVVTVTLQLMSSTPGSAASRKLDSGPSELSFDIFTDLLRTRLWGDGTTGTFTITGLIALTAVNATQVVEFPVYGRIPTRLASPAGAYTGQFMITLRF